MRRKAVTARIPEHEVALVERAAEVLGYTRSTFVRKAAVGVALYQVARQVDPAEAYARQAEVMASGAGGGACARRTRSNVTAGAR